MILPKSNRLTPEQLNEVTAIVTEFGCKIQPIIGAVRTIYAIVGDEREELMINRLEGLDYIDRIDRIQSPFKLMDKRSDLASHRITIGGITLGEELFVIAGTCTIDPKNPNYFYETAAAVKEAGANMIRGGVWKPRTNPYTFQGDVKSLDILLEGARRTGLPVDTEVMEARPCCSNVACTWDRSVNSSRRRNISRPSATRTSSCARAAPLRPSTATAIIPTRASRRC
jgi:3-deoxy-7-phosphoheptulonate synthase